MGNYIDDTYVSNMIDATTLAQLSSSTGALDTSVVDEIIDAAEGILDSFICNRYPTPVTATEMVKAHTYNIFLKIMYNRRPGKIPENIINDYNMTLDFLRAVARGELSLNNSRNLPDYDNSRYDEGKVFEFFDKDDDSYISFP